MTIGRYDMAFATAVLEDEWRWQVRIMHACKLLPLLTVLAAWHALPWASSSSYPRYNAVHDHPDWLMAVQQHRGWLGRLHNAMAVSSWPYSWGVNRLILAVCARHAVTYYLHCSH